MEVPVDGTDPPETYAAYTTSTTTVISTDTYVVPFEIGAFVGFGSKEGQGANRCVRGP
jgi:hypothetical protein